MFAANAHVSSSHGQSFACAHCSSLEVSAFRRPTARLCVPRASVRACPLQHLELPTPCCRPTSHRVPRPTVRAQHLQLIELSAPRRCLTKEFLTRQATLSLPALQCAQTSERYGCILAKLLEPKPRRRHRVAHRAAHRWEPCEVGGIVEMLRSENVRGDEVVEEAGDGVLRVGKARESVGGRVITVRASHGGMRCVGRQYGGWRVRVVVCRGFRESIRGFRVSVSLMTMKRFLFKILHPSILRLHPSIHPPSV